MVTIREIPLTKRAKELDAAYKKAVAGAKVGTPAEDDSDDDD